MSLIEIASNVVICCTKVMLRVNYRHHLHPSCCCHWMTYYRQILHRLRYQEYQELPQRN